jgi:hypothetical protein
VDEEPPAAAGEPSSAPPITHLCGIAPELAQGIVVCRSTAGRVTTVDDVFAWADLPYEIWDLVRDRGVVLEH